MSSQMKDYLHARKKLFAQALIQTFPFSCVHKTDWFPIAFPAYQTLWFFIFSFIAECAYEILYLINLLIRFSFPEGVFPRILKYVANSVRPALKIDARRLQFVHIFRQKKNFQSPAICMTNLGIFPLLTQIKPNTELGRCIR